MWDGNEEGEEVGDFAEAVLDDVGVAVLAEDGELEVAAGLVGVPEAGDLVAGGREAHPFPRGQVALPRSLGSEGGGEEEGEGTHDGGRAEELPLGHLLGGGEEGDVGATAPQEGVHPVHQLHLLLVVDEPLLDTFGGSGGPRGGHGGDGDGHGGAQLSSARLRPDAQSTDGQGKAGPPVQGSQK